MASCELVSEKAGDSNQQEEFYHNIPTSCSGCAIEGPGCLGRLVFKRFPELDSPDARNLCCDPVLDSYTRQFMFQRLSHVELPGNGYNDSTWTKQREGKGHAYLIKDDDVLNPSQFGQWLGNLIENYPLAAALLIPNALRLAI